MLFLRSLRQKPKWIGYIDWMVEIEKAIGYLAVVFGFLFLSKNNVILDFASLLDWKCAVEKITVF